MHIVFIIFLVVMLSVWLLSAVGGFWAARKEPRKVAWVLRAAALLLVVGGLGFFGSALSAMGGLNWLPPSFEWPVGYAPGVVSTGDYYYVVPLGAAGRIQIYDSEWKFIRGWPVQANGGSFLLQVTNYNQISVLTSRGSRHFVFQTDGKLLSEDTAPLGAYSTFGSPSQTHWVRTAPWLLPFSSPFLAAACAFLGIAINMAHQRPETRSVWPVAPIARILSKMKLM
jgi:hypothetical protein